jgi:signal transduction histidine kinase
MSDTKTDQSGLKPVGLNEIATLEPREPPFWLLFSLLSLVWIVVGCVFALQIIAFENVSASFAIRLALMDWGPWILVSPLVLWLSKHVEIRSGTWQWALPLHLLAAIAIAGALELLVYLSMDSGFIERAPQMRERFEMGDRNDEMGMSDERLAPPEKPPMRMIHVRVNMPIYWVLVAAAHAMAFHRRSMQKERRALIAEASLAEARLAALQAQINPHFLFNTLNAIAQYVHEDPVVAERMIESLSTMLRLVLAASDKRDVTLKEEIDFVDHYLDIQKMRFADRLKVERDIDANALSALVPTLLLQPLVENAIIHGIARARKQGVLTIKAMAQNGRLHIQVSDTGSGVPFREKVGQIVTIKERVGVGNTRARLKAAFSNNFTFTHSVAPEGGLCVSIDLPLSFPPGKQTPLP